MKKMISLVIMVLIMSACTPSVAMDTLTVYFLDENAFAIGVEPYEKAVTRTIPVTTKRMTAVLDQLFLGPTVEEKEQGLTVVLSGTTGYSDFDFHGGIAHVTLAGDCNSGGSTYTIANLIFANLEQFDGIRWIKIYDQKGETEVPEGPSNSIPFCLEP